jgi:MFS family permease
VFCAWGVLVAIFAVFGAPALKSRYGTARTLISSLILIAVILGVIGVFPGDRWVVIVAVIASGALIGMNNTLVTTAVMSIAPVPRGVASASYGFVRFIGGGLAPYVAGRLVASFNTHVPFLLAAVVVLAGTGVVATLRPALDEADAGETQHGHSEVRKATEEAVTEIPGESEEAILAGQAFREERIFGEDRVFGEER